MIFVFVEWFQLYFYSKILTNCVVFNSSFWRLQSLAQEPHIWQNIFNVGESSINTQGSLSHHKTQKLHEDKIPLSCSKGPIHVDGVFYTMCYSYCLKSVFRKSPFQTFWNLYEMIAVNYISAEGSFNNYLTSRIWPISAPVTRRCSSVIQRNMITDRGWKLSRAWDINQRNFVYKQLSVT